MPTEITQSRDVSPDSLSGDDGIAFGFCKGMPSYTPRQRDRREAMADLARRGHLVQVAKNRFFLPETVLELAAIAAELAAASADRRFGAAAYRDRSGLGRNLTIEVLECLDRTGVTRFEGGRRRMAEAVVP